MALDHETQHFEKGLVSLAGPFWGRPRVAALLRAYLRQVQNLEDCAQEVLAAFDINVADAERLAVLGRVVGTPNFGWDLETYRAVIRAKIATNRSRGLESDITNVLRLITGNYTDPIVTHSLVPATLLVEMGYPVSDEHMVAVRFLLPKARAAGVRLNFTAPIEGGFTFDNSVSPLAGAGTFDNSVSPMVGAGVFGTTTLL